MKTERQLLCKPRGPAFLFLCWAFVLWTPEALSQDESPGQAMDDGDVIELSPFLVEADPQGSYLTQDTLAGTRIRTDISDLGAAISIYNDQFLDDTASTDLTDLLVYTTGTEVTGTGGNYSDTAAGAVSSLENQDARVRPQDNTRIRGLAEADLTRDFYLTNIPFDSYNTESVTINRGSNNILFGLGSPAGIIENSLISAKFFNRNELSFTYDSFDGLRTTFDINRMIADQELSVRFAGLYEDERFDIDPAYERDKRIFGAITYRPLKNTTLRANFESGEIRANRPRFSPPVDLVSAWFDPSANAFPDRTDENGKPFMDPANETFNAVGPNGETLSPTQYFGPFAYIFAPGIVLTEPDQTERSFIDATPVITGNRNDTGQFILFGTIRPTAVSRQLSGEPFAGFLVNDQITDPTIFDFNSKLLDGPNKLEWADFEAFNISVEHLFLDNQAGIELEYDQQTFDDGFFSAYGTSRFGTWLAVDVNKTLPDGRLNEHYGRPFASGAPTGDMRSNERKSFRSQFFINFDLEKRLPDSLLGEFLGRHTLTGLYNVQQIDETFASASNGWAWGQDRANFTTQAGARDITNGAWRVLGNRVYLGESLASSPSPRNANISNVRSTLRPRSSETVYLFNDASKEWEQQQISTVLLQNEPHRLYSSANLTRNEIDSYAAVAQSKWLRDLVVTTVGFRSDEATVFENPNPPRDPIDNHVIIDPRRFTLPETAAGKVKSEVWSWSAVGHLPEAYFENLSLVSGLSFHYAESSNFIPAPGRTNVFGESLGSPSGETVEKGFTVRGTEDRIRLRVNWYETTQSNVAEGSFPDVDALLNFETDFLLEFEGIIAAEDSLREQFPEYQDLPPFETLKEFIDPDTLAPINYPQQILEAVNYDAQDSDGDGFPELINISPPAGRVATTDFVTEGVEIELTGNITENWRAHFNAARQEAVRSNSGPALRELLELRLPVYQQIGDFPNNVSGDETIISRLNRDVVIPIQRVLAQEGAVLTNEIREWRANLATTYTFTEDSVFGGILNGFSVGGSIRWEDRIGIGYRGTVDPELGEIIDVKNPIFGRSDTTIDAWLEYERPLWNESVDWSIQLNIKNLTDDDELQPVFANPDGGIAGWRIKRPRLFQLTNRFAF